MAAPGEMPAVPTYRVQSNSTGASDRKGTAGAAGFTLIELVVVMVIIAVATAVAVPAMRAGAREREIRQTLQQFVATVRRTSSMAVLRRETVELWVSPGEHRYAVAVARERRRADQTDEELRALEAELDDLELSERRRMVANVSLPKLASFGEIEGGRELVDGTIAFRFLPTGGSSGGAIELVFGDRQPKRSYVLEIDPLVSDIDIRDDEDR